MLVDIPGVASVQLIPSSSRITLLLLLKAGSGLEVRG
jgi:hypothetical protein